MMKTLLLSAVLPALVCCSVTDKPPVSNTPAPAAHHGVFVCGRDTLVMNGDGRTVTWHFQNAVAELGSRGQGEYVFLFFSGKYRYDLAEEFRIIDTAHNNAHHSFRLEPGSATEKGFTIIRDDMNSSIQTFQRVP